MLYEACFDSIDTSVPSFFCTTRSKKFSSFDDALSWLKKNCDSAFVCAHIEGYLTDDEIGDPLDVRRVYLHEGRFAEVKKLLDM